MQETISKNINTYKGFEEFAEYNGLHLDDVVRLIMNEEITDFNLSDLNGMSVKEVINFLDENNVFTINGNTYIDRT